VSTDAQRGGVVRQLSIVVSADAALATQVAWRTVHRGLLETGKKTRYQNM